MIFNNLLALVFFEQVGNEEEGMIYQDDELQPSPEIVEVLYHKPFKSIACGYFHTVAVSGKGKKSSFSYFRTGIVYIALDPRVSIL